MVLEYNNVDADRDLQIKKFSSPTNSWARFVAANRLDGDDSLWEGFDNNRNGQYDVVIGPTADGRENLQNMLHELQSGKLKVSQVKSEMCYPNRSSNWGTQVSFHTSKSLEYIRIKRVSFELWKEDTYE